MNTGSHTADEARKYADVARRYGFLASRGSDFHSPTESRMDLGRLPALPPDLKPVWHDWFCGRPRPLRHAIDPDRAHAAPPP